MRWFITIVMVKLVPFVVMVLDVLMIFQLKMVSLKIFQSLKPMMGFILLVFQVIKFRYQLMK